MRSSFVLWAAFVLAHLWLGLLNLDPRFNAMGDVTSVYRFWVDQFVVNRFLVGIDSQWVYPILAFVPMLVALAFGGTLYGSTWLSMVMVLNVVAFGVLTGWGRRRDHNAAAWWWVVFLFAIGPIALGRIDSVTVPIALVGVLLLGTRPRVAAFVLTIGAWIKVWPAAIVAAVVVASKQRFPLAVTAVVTSLVIISIALLFGSGSNVLSFVTQQTGRGLQVESPVSTIWMWMAATGVPGATVYYDTGILTFQVDGPGAGIASALMTPLLAVVALAICGLGVLAVRRGATTTELLPPLSLALVTAFIVVNKVGSPQFESWLVVPVVLGLVTALRGGMPFRVPAGLALVIAALTQVIYPYLYGQLLALDPLMLVALSARNLLLVVLLGWAVLAIARTGRRGDEPHIHAARPTSWPLTEQRDDAMENQPQ